MSEIKKAIETSLEFINDEGDLKEILKLSLEKIPMANQRLWIVFFKERWLNEVR